MDDVALNLLKTFEGFSSKVYKDAAGHLTVGFGHKLLAGEAPFYVGREITKDEGEKLLVSDYGKHRGAVLSLVPGSDLVEHELGALTSFCFNFGERKLADSTLLRHVRAGNREGVAVEFPKWRYYKDSETGEMKPAPGLIRRRHVEACWYLGASWSTLMYILGDNAA